MDQSIEAQNSRNYQKISLVLRCVIALFFISGIVGVFVRFSGDFVGIGFLRDTLPIKAINLGVGFAIFFLTMVYGMWRQRYAAIYLFAFFLLTWINLGHLVFSAPAKPDAWNTIPFEALRSFGLGWYIYAGFSISKNTLISHRKISMWVLYSSILLVLFALLQSIGILPNFYFQWYGGFHLPRPTGGLDHPHFFALLLVQSSCLAVISFEQKTIRKRTAIFFMIAFFIGILVSTSRVGLIAEVVFLTVYAYLRLDFARLAILAICLIFAVALFTLWITLNWGVVSHWSIVNSVTVFLSAFQESFGVGGSDGQFLRGRGERWEHELELITAAPETLLMGYGHQPFVSHNLLLRQMQVSGIVGTLSYLTMLVSFAFFWISKVPRNARAPIYAFFASFSVSSITFPVFVSVTIVCGVVLLAALTISTRPGVRVK